MTKSKSKYVGVDGCKAGWFSVGLDGDCGYEVKVFEKFCSLVDYYSAACLILVDIPIGLPSPGPEPRSCDSDARKKLGNRSSSVFRVPLREVVHTVLHGATREEADELSRSLNSKGIGVQVFNIAKKIAKVDEVMTTHNKNTVARIREIHPEVCFWSLTGQAMKTNKKPVSGSCERLTALRTVEKQTDDIYQKACSQWRRYEVARDDILDALVAAVTAKLSYTDAYTLQSIPAVPQWDEEKCLRMEMVYSEKVTS